MSRHNRGRRRPVIPRLDVDELLAGNRNRSSVTGSDHDGSTADGIVSKSNEIVSAGNEVVSESNDLPQGLFE